jgi:hypothetical protein
MLNPNDVNTVFNQCRVELTGVSEALLKSALFETLDEFFRDSSCWKEELTVNVAPPSPQPTTPQGWEQALSYPISPTEGQIIALDGVCNSNGSFVAATLPMSGTAASGLGGADAVLLLQGAPSQAQQYTVYVTKTVALPLTRDGLPAAPAWVLQKWHLAVKSGILGMLKNQKNKSYSDATGAKYNLSKFRQYVANVRSATLRANTRGASAWRFPQSFRSLSQKGGVPSYSTGNERG